MSKVHISNDGMARRCNAKTPDTCTAQRVEGLEGHFDTIKEAQDAYEKHASSSQAFLPLKKKKVQKKVVKLTPLTDKDVKSASYRQELEFAIEHGGTDKEIATRANILYHFGKSQSQISTLPNNESGVKRAQAAVKNMEQQHKNMVASGIFNQEEIQAHKDSVELVKVDAKIIEYDTDNNSTVSDFEKLREQAEKEILSDNTKSIATLHIDSSLRRKKAALNNPEKHKADRQSYKHNTLKRELDRFDTVDLFLDDSGETLKKYDDLVAEMKQNIDEAKKSAHSSIDIANMENDVVLHSLVQNVRHRNDLSELETQKVNFPLFASQKRKKEILAEHERKIKEKRKFIEEQAQDNNNRVTENNLNPDLLESSLRAKMSRVRVLNRR